MERTQLYSRPISIIVFPALPRGIPGEGPEGHLHSKTKGLGPVPARIWGECVFSFDLGLKGNGVVAYPI
jgi:hypothetical protein